MGVMVAVVSRGSGVSVSEPGVSVTAVRVNSAPGAGVIGGSPGGGGGGGGSVGGGSGMMTGGGGGGSGTITTGAGSVTTLGASRNEVRAFWRLCFRRFVLIVV